MARDTAAVTALQAWVRTCSPLHIGGLGAVTGQDAPVARDALGRLILPGTSIAGALRGALGQSVDQLDAPTDTWGAADTDGLGASRVVVHDAMVGPAREAATAQGGVALGRRDGVAIDRAWGSAVDGLLYGREVVPAGWWALVTVEVHSAPGAETADLALLARLRAELLGGLWLGARTSRGLGEVRAGEQDVTITQLRYDSPEAFWTTRRTPAAVTLPDVASAGAGVLEVEIDWRPDGPVVVGSGAATARLSFLPLVEPAPAEDGSPGGDRLRLVLPGTAIAGALRARAELICRTLDGRDPPTEFAEQLLDCPLVAALFGAAAGTANATWSPLQVLDCQSVSTISAAEWYATADTGSDDVAPRNVPATGAAELRRTEHVAIDRWTGGASDGRLFTEYEPHGFAFALLRLRLRRDLLPAGVRDPATMLLLVTLRELVEGRLPLGGRTHRGYGAVTVSGVRLRGCGLDVTTGGPLDLHAEEFAGLRSAWRSRLEVLS